MTKSLNAFGRDILIRYHWSDSFILCSVNLFTVSAVVSGKITIRPPGPIDVAAGTTVFIDCSSDEQWRPDIWWFRWFVPLSYPSYAKDTTANNVTFGPHGEGRIGYQWIDENVLQLIISSAEKQDSGIYWCVLDQQEYRSVELDVVDSPQLLQNASS